MKKVLVSIILSLFTCLAFANSPINFGVNFRVDMPRATFESTDWDSFFNDLDQNKSIDNVQNVLDASDMGYAGGVFFRYNKNKSFIHTEAMFSFNNTSMTCVADVDDHLNSVITYSSENTVFNLPVYWGRNMIDNSVFKVRAFTGPTFSWMLDASTSGIVDYNDGSPTSELLNSNVTTDNFDWLWTIGGGVELFMFSLDVRYGFDIKGVENVNDFNTSFDQSTNKLEFTLGFKFL